MLHVLSSASLLSILYPSPPSPPLSPHPASLPRSRMCWKVVARSGQTAIFQKPLDGQCYSQREESTRPEICDASNTDVTNPDVAWYTPMSTCLAAPSPGEQNGSGGRWEVRGRC